MASTLTEKGATRRTTLLASSLRIMAGVPIVSLFAGGLLLLFLGATLRGRSVGLSAVILGGVLFCAVGFWNRPWFARNRGRRLTVLIPIGLMFYIIPMMLAPNGKTDSGHVRNYFLHGRGAVCRYAPWNVIPEADQLRVGICLLPFGDPYVDFVKAARIRALMLPAYREMDRDAAFRELGSVLNMAGCEVCHLEFRTGHYYAYVPEVTHGTKLPGLIFLHGQGGNNKLYLWVLSRLAVQAKCIVIVPTFGLGNWSKDGGAALVTEVAHEAVAKLPLDPKKLFLMGYSNGAMGVTRAAARESGLFQGLIYLSPVTEDELFASKGFIAGARNFRILFLHGGRDERIPKYMPKGTVLSLKQMGCNVRLKTFEDEDHYLLFSQPEAVRGEIMAFMNANTVVGHE